MNESDKQWIGWRPNEGSPTVLRPPVPVLRGVHKPKRVELCRAAIDIFGVDQPKLEEGKEKESDRETVAVEKGFGGECRISRVDHWQITWMNGIAARRSGALTLDSFLCYAF